MRAHVCVFFRRAYTRVARVTPGVGAAGALRRRKPALAPRERPQRETPQRAESRGALGDSTQVPRRLSANWLQKQVDAHLFFLPRGASPLTFRPSAKAPASSCARRRSFQIALLLLPSTAISSAHALDTYTLGGLRASLSGALNQRSAPLTRPKRRRVGGTKRLLGSGVQTSTSPRAARKTAKGQARTTAKATGRWTATAATTGGKDMPRFRRLTVPRPRSRSRVLTATSVFALCLSLP